MITAEEMDMYTDLHPFINTTPYTVVENMSVAKALVLFRQCALRHLLIVPKYQGAGVSFIRHSSMLTNFICSVFRAAAGPVCYYSRLVSPSPPQLHHLRPHLRTSGIPPVFIALHRPKLLADHRRLAPPALQLAPPFLRRAKPRRLHCVGLPG